jgi:hypothetical protein
MDIEAAKRIALEFINQDYDLSCYNDSVFIRDEQTEILEYGWIFYYNSKKFLETGDFMNMLLGHNPVFVDKNNGQVLYIRGDLDLEDAIDILG